jgi:hypothetical protein
LLDIKVTGANEIEKLLRQLERKEAANAVRKGTRETQKETILVDAQNNVNSLVGGSMGSAIAKNLVVRAMTKLLKFNYGHKVIIKETDAFVYESKNTGTRYYIPFAIEYGHAFPGRGSGVYMAKGMSEKRAKQKASGNKDVAPIQFMRKAFEANRKKAVDVLRDKVLRHLEDAVNKYRKAGS